MPGYANVTRLKRVQAGLETTRGTAGSVTRRVYGAAMLKHSQDIIEVPDESGDFWGGDVIVSGEAEVGFTIEAVCTHEDLPWWLELGLKGGVVAVAGTGTPLPYTRTYTPSGTVDDLKTATWEYGWGTTVYRSTMVGVRNMTIMSNRGDAVYWKITADLFARDLAAIGAFTAAIPSRTREAILARGAKLYIDEPAGTVGTTQVIGKYRSFSVTIDNGIDFKRFGESDIFVAPDFGRGQQVVTGEIVLEQVDDVEYAKQRLATARRIRLESLGSIINGVGATPKRARIDLGNAYWNAPTEGTAGENITQSFGYVAKPSAGVAPITIESVTGLLTLP